MKFIQVDNKIDAGL